MSTLLQDLQLPRSITEVLAARGLAHSEAIDALLNPSLDRLASPHAFLDMQIAVDRLLAAVRAEEPIAIYADRDVDGLTGLAVLARTLRSLGGIAFWGSPQKGRGVEREVLERLIQTGAKVMVLVDCGTAENTELAWLKSQGIDVIVADHHRFTADKPEALAWIHPGVQQHPSPRPSPFKGEGVMVRDGFDAPAGCVMAFKLAQAIWLSFLGQDEPERMDYFLYSHLDLICLGILADRMPLHGENRILVWHGLRRLASSRKAGISALTRFFRLTPRSSALTVREVTWQIIPLLNAGGRLGRPELTAELLLTEDLDVAHDCINELMVLNTQRRAAQGESLESFEKAVLEQCSTDTDSVLVALAEGLEPSVTGLAAQALVRKYHRPVFLFVNQGEYSVGSGRGLPEVDLFAWIEAHPQFLVKYGGHQGAVGMTIRTADFAALRDGLLSTAQNGRPLKENSAAVEHGDISIRVESHVTLAELDTLWWMALERLGPFGTAHPLPLFQVNGIEWIATTRKRKSANPLESVIFRHGALELRGEADDHGFSERARKALDDIDAALAEKQPGRRGPWTVIGYPVADRRGEKPFCWKIRDMWKEKA
jgi:single-stranded-DNA-specific exonuclease